jgi:peptidyl-prolyl cis-trans isomerase SurA
MNRKILNVMMTKFAWIVILSFFYVTTVFAQKQSKPILQIGSQTYSLNEFQYVYSKNNQQSQSQLSPEEYLELFVNYKLKVTDAINKGYDTIPSFVNEFNYYREELAKPYLTDKKATENLALEAYERLQWEIDASHILIRLSDSPTPEDTLKAYRKIEEIAAKLKNGQSFEELSVQYSEDPSASMNKGRLGYFTGFQMVYPFESAAFTTPEGSVSSIIRTGFGYHLIKVHHKRPSRGEILVAHIMKTFPYNSPAQVQDAAQAKIDSLYTLLQQGADFGSLAEDNSDDRNSAVNKGELPWFGSGRMIPEFANPAFQLVNNGDISRPVKTQFGWHIIKRLNHRSLESFESMKDEITERISSDERAFAGQEATIKKLKTEYGFKLNTKSLNEMRPPAEADSAYFATLTKSDSPLFSFAKETVTQKQFANYLKSITFQSPTEKAAMFDQHLHTFISNQLIEFEKERLEQKYPDYKNLLAEYHDGLLIFEISRREIWDKAADDTTGLLKYYEEKKAFYASIPYVEGSVFYCKDLATENQLKQILARSETVNVDSLINNTNNLKLNVRQNKGPFNKGDNPVVDAAFFENTTYTGPLPEGFTSVITQGKLVTGIAPELNHIRGRVLSDYQNHLEKLWIDSLHKELKPKIYPKLLKTITTVKK